MYQKVFDKHAEILKALAHPKRLEIVQLLREQELSVSEIQEMLDLEQSNLSQHLSILRDVKILDTRRDSKNIYYKLSDRRFLTASDTIREIIADNYSKDSDFKEINYEIGDLVPLTKDPVCKMRLSPKTASFNIKFEKDVYFFCASGCLDKFKKSPKKYV